MSMELFSENWEILMVALFLVSVHVIGPRVHDLRRHPDYQEAFGAGLSVAYVFLHLIPALDGENDPLGQRVYFVALLGFTLFYWLDIHFIKHEKRRYGTELAALFVYNFLMVFTLGLNLPSTPLLTAIFAFTLALDALDTDIDLCGRYGSRFVRHGRWVLTGGVLFGYGLGLAKRPEPFVVDAVTAALAGMMLFMVAKGLFPVSAQRRFPAFLGGMALFAVLHVVLDAFG
jgi:hypothetical protein